MFLNTDPYLDWVLREKAAKAAEFILATIEGHLARLSGFSIVGYASVFIVFLTSPLT